MCFNFPLSGTKQRESGNYWSGRDFLFADIWFWVSNLFNNVDNVDIRKGFYSLFFLDSTNCVINNFDFLWGIMHVFVLIFFIDNDVVERNVSPFSFWKAECMHRTYWAILNRFVLSAMLVNKQCNAMQCLNTETGYCDAPRSRTVHFGSGSGNRHFGSL